MSKKIQVRLVRSAIGRDKLTRDRLASIGLKRVGDVKVVAYNVTVKGTISKLGHMVRASEVKE